MHIIDKGKNLEKNGKWQEALDWYLSQHSLSDPTLYLDSIGWCYSRLSQFDKAIEKFNLLIEYKPTARNYYMLGYQYYSKSDWKKAVEYFEIALELNQDYFVVLYRLSYSCLKLAGSYLKLTKKEFWDAIRYFERTHKIWKSFEQKEREDNKRTYYLACFSHGKAISGLDNYKMKCIKLFQYAYSLYADEACAYNLAKQYAYIGDFEKAKSILPKTKKYYVRELKCEIEINIGNLDYAIDEYLNLLKIRNKDYIMLRLAELYIEKKELDSAYIYCRKALIVNANNHKGLLILGKIMHEKKQYQLSKKYLEDAIESKQKRFNLEYIEAEQLISQMFKNNDFEKEDDTSELERLNKLVGIQGRNEGLIVKLHNRGYGFIKQGNTNYFFHKSELLTEDIVLGDKVTFKIGSNKSGPCAIEVKKI